MDGDIVAAGDPAVEEVVVNDDPAVEETPATGLDDETIGQIVAAVVGQVTEATTRQLDSRITGLVKTLDKKYGDRPKPEGEGESGGEKPDPYAARFLRSAVMETLNRETFGSPEEAKAAMKLAVRLAGSRGLQSFEDDYEVAAEIVAEVKSTLDSLRATYEERIRADLKQRGLLTDGDVKDGPRPPKKPTGGSTAQEEFDKGAARAAAIRKPRA